MYLQEDVEERHLKGPIPGSEGLRRLGLGVQSSNKRLTTLQNLKTRNTIVQFNSALVIFGALYDSKSPFGLLLGFTRSNLPKVEKQLSNLYFFWLPLALRFLTTFFSEFFFNVFPGKAQPFAACQAPLLKASRSKRSHRSAGQKAAEVGGAGGSRLFSLTWFASQVGFCQLFFADYFVIRGLKLVFQGFSVGLALLLWRFCCLRKTDRGLGRTY